MALTKRLQYCILIDVMNWPSTSLISDFNPKIFLPWEIAGWLGC